MAKTEKVQRDIKTWEIVKLLANTYSESGHYACATEVANSTGGYAGRWLDFVVVDCWPSSGLKIAGFEVKISKSDFRRELTDPSKHNVFFDEIDYYSIVAPDYVLDDMRIVPPKWGVYHVVRNADGKLELKTVRKPLALHDEQQRDRKISRGFMASLVRAIDKQGATKARLHEDHAELKERIRAEVENELVGGHVIKNYEYEEYMRLHDICSKLGLLYCDMSESKAKHFKEASVVTDKIHYVERYLSSLASAVKCAHKSLKDLLNGINNDGGDPSEALKSISGKIAPDGTPAPDVLDV